MAVGWLVMGVRWLNVGLLWGGWPWGWQMTTGGHR